MILRLCAALLLLSSCAHRGTAKKASGPTGLLDIACPVDDARLYVDEHLSASGLQLRSAPLRLSVGAHRLELRAEGHFPLYRDVTITENTRQRLELNPEPIPAGY